jgi:meiotically up-regulated gene 157 (Mug157) protein
LKSFEAAKKAIKLQIESLPAELAQHRALAKLSADRLFDDAATLLDGNHVFISTGDIDAMWLRDSSFQVRPLLRFAQNDAVREFIAGVIKQQAKFIAIDPYANAFNIEANSNRWHKDFEDQSPWVFERKWEIDSLACFLDVSLGLAETAGTTHLDNTWWRAAEAAVGVFEAETNHDPESYVLKRPGAPKHDWLFPDGRGSEFKNCGLIWSAFRPSDDACELAFNIPQNAFAASQLERLSKFAKASIASRCQALAKKIRNAIYAHATIHGHFAYEIDGLGNFLEMDDANIPSLLSLPYLGFCEQDDPTYLATRDFALSNRNPWFFSGSQASHIGSPHTGQNRMWPLAMAMQIITSKDVELEKLGELASLAIDSNGFHESVDVDDVRDFTREWFSWAEMTYFDAVFVAAEKIK